MFEIINFNEIALFQFSDYIRNPSELFFRNDVQNLLHKMTGRDYDIIFRASMLGHKLQPPRYDLLTNEEVDKLMAKTEIEASKKLKMPPLLEERRPINKILAKNPELQGFDTSKYVFTDISYGLTNRVSK